MKKGYGVYFLLLASILIYQGVSYAATVGNPLDLDVPSNSSMLRQRVIEGTMDEAEQMIKIKTSLDLEFVFDKDLDSSSEVGSPEISGQWHMVKIGATVLDRVEPYIKLGTSVLTAEWKQNNQSNIEVESETGFAWGAGLKAVLWDFDDWGVRLTGDLQYRHAEPDAAEITKNASTVTDTGADFEISEYQLSFIASKKFELPLKWQSLFIVPYAGFSLSDSTVDVSFKDPNAPGAAYSLFNASNGEKLGLIFGCDILPSLTSSFIYSLELRLINELALSLGGTVKF
ncbi:MAG: hypothetical protein ABIG92_02665 [Candidatus Omnitrophota bacterium]